MLYNNKTVVLHITIYYDAATTQSIVSIAMEDSRVPIYKYGMMKRCLAKNSLLLNKLN